jgi:RimJ/RimL family protein N-acetyltransferase
MVSRVSDEARVTLRDRSRMVVRPIRPDDKGAIVAGFERLSPESRYRRFFEPVQRLTDQDLSYLTEVDHRDHEALIAVEPRTGHGIGVARFVRSAGDPERAEVAVAVADSWHGRGVATALLHRLVERAREEGVRRFSAEILAENRPMLDLIDDLGEVRVTDREHGAIEVEVALPAEGIGAALRETLRAAARDLLRVPNLMR